MDKACVHVYTGEGKGKTTAAAGLAVRAVGQGLRVAFVQFLKNGVSGEGMALAKLGAQVLCPQSGRFVWEMDDAEKVACAQKQAETLARAAQLAPEYDLVVLDEVICAVNTGMLEEGVLVDFVKARPAGTELVLTGRDAPAALVQLADYCTEMRAVKHPYDTGQKARRGIEY